MEINLIIMWEFLSGLGSQPSQDSTPLEVLRAWPISFVFFIASGDLHKVVQIYWNIESIKKCVQDTLAWSTFLSVWENASQVSSGILVFFFSWRIVRESLSGFWDIFSHNYIESSLRILGESHRDISRNLSWMINPSYETGWAPISILGNPSLNSSKIPPKILDESLSWCWDNQSSGF